MCRPTPYLVFGTPTIRNIKKDYFEVKSGSKKGRYIKMSASNKERKVPVLVDKPMDFCPDAATES